MEYQMKWHKFLIYFGLWASGALNVVNGFRYMTGGQYGDAYSAKMVYMLWDAMKGLDVFIGIVFIALGILCIVTRFALAGFKKSGPMMLTIVYGVNCAIIIVYCLVASGITGISMGEMISDSVSSLVTSAVMIFVSSKYYSKRSELFVN